MRCIIAGLGISPDWTSAHAIDFTAVTAALPALGSAVYGIRVQGDFGGAASRSAKAVSQLERLSAGLTAEPPQLVHSGRGARRIVARVMLADLAEWQVTYRQRGLDIPA